MGNNEIDKSNDKSTVISKEKEDTVNIASRSQDTKIIKWLRWSKTVLLVLTYIGVGMGNSMLFASIPDLRVRLGTDIEGISYAFAFGSFGALVSTPLAAVADRFGKFSELTMGCCLVLSAFSNLTRPYTTKLWVFGVCHFLDNVAWTLISNVGNSLVLLMWGASGQSALHAMHFGYPFGAAVGGQIARAFVSTNITDNCTSVDPLECHTNILPEWSFLPIDFAGVHESMNEFPDGSRIEIGFLITSMFNLAIGLLFLVFQFTSNTRLKKMASKRSFKWSEILYPSKWAGGNTRFGLFIFIMATLLQMALQGCDKGIAQYLSTYAVDSDLGFNNQEAATLSSIYYLLGAVGIFSCIFVSKYLSLKAMFMIEVHGIIVVSVFFVILGTINRTALYVFAAAFGLFTGSAWPTSYGWPNNYIIILSALLGVTRITRNIADIFMNALQGYLYSNTVIESIFYTTLAYGVLLCILMYIVYYHTRNVPSRHQLAERHQENSEIYINSVAEESMREETLSPTENSKQSEQTITTYL